MVDMARRGWPRVAFSGDAEGAFPNIIIPGLMRIGISSDRLNPIYRVNPRKLWVWGNTDNVCVWRHRMVFCTFEDHR